MATKSKKDLPTLNKWQEFPTRVHLLKSGEYIGKIYDLKSDKTVTPNTITVFVRTDKGEELSKTYTVEYFGKSTLIKDSSPLYFFLKGMNSITVTGLIKWSKLMERKVKVIVKDRQSGTYTKSIKPYNGDEEDSGDESKENNTNEEFFD